MKISIILLIFLINPILIQAYANGIENGDTVELEIDGRTVGGSRDGEIFQNRTVTIFQVLRSKLIEGFYNALLGMKEGEIKNNVIIPPDKGYTDKKSDLYNQTLSFNIYFIKLIADFNAIKPTVPDTTNETHIFTSFVRIASVILMGLFVIYVYIILNNRRKRISKGIWNHCNSSSEGMCARCIKCFGLVLLYP